MAAFAGAAVAAAIGRAVGPDVAGAKVGYSVGPLTLGDAEGTSVGISSADCISIGFVVGFEVALIASLTGAFAGGTAS